jgi:hypothetical protein
MLIIEYEIFFLFLSFRVLVAISWGI